MPKVNQVPHTVPLSVLGFGGWGMGELVVLLFHYFITFIMHLSLFEPPHDKISKWIVRSAKTKISLAASAQSDQSLRCPRKKLGSLATH